MINAPDPMQIATRLANGKHVSFEAVMTLRDAMKNPEVMMGRSEEDRLIIERALEIMADMFKISSIPPPPPSNGTSPRLEPPALEAEPPKP